jgi:hypothetical protein
MVEPITICAANLWWAAAAARILRDSHFRTPLVQQATRNILAAFKAR